MLFHNVRPESSSTGSSSPTDFPKPLPLAVASLESRKEQRESRKSIYARYQLDDEAFGYLKRVRVSPAVHHRLFEFHHFDTAQISHCVNTIWGHRNALFELNSRIPLVRSSSELIVHRTGKASRSIPNPSIVTKRESGLIEVRVHEDEPPLVSKHTWAPVSRTKYSMRFRSSSSGAAAARHLLLAHRFSGAFLFKPLFPISSKSLWNSPASIASSVRSSSILLSIEKFVRLLFTTLSDTLSDKIVMLRKVSC